MEAVIRSAVLGTERRRLVRPALSDAVAVPAPESVPTVTSDTVHREEIERLKCEHADEVIAIRRDLEGEREKLRAAMAAEHSEALREAAEAGFAEGLGRGEAEGRARLDAAAVKLDALAAELQACRAQVIEEAEDMLVEIAFAAMCRIAGTEASSRAAIVHAVRERASHLRAADTISVLVHPDDLESLDAAAARWDNVTFIANPAVAVGGCLIEGASGTLDARLDVQLTQLAAALANARAARRAGESE
jgi:flagellar assembly protein FliH